MAEALWWIWTPTPSSSCEIILCSQRTLSSSQLHTLLGKNTCGCDWNGGTLSQGMRRKFKNRIFNISYAAQSNVYLPFVQKPRSDTVRGSLRLLTSSAFRLQSECKKAMSSEGGTGPDMQLVTQQVIQCAFDIAKAAKQLVTLTTKENTN